MQWRLNRIQYPICNLGPGVRAGIWVQGCSIRCHGCISPSLWDQNGGSDVEIPYLVMQMQKLNGCVDGITVTGGEPFDQYEALVLFCAFVKKMMEVNIFIFSGYTLEELLERFSDRLFLQHIDFLMDGRYKAERHADRNVRGSANQRLYRIEKGHPRLVEPSVASSCWSLTMGENGRFFMSGIPKEGELEMIKTDLHKMGIKMEFV